MAQDKQLHFLLSFFIASMTAGILFHLLGNGAFIAGFLIPMLFGVYKEIQDDIFDLTDLACDFAGTLSGLWIIFVMI